MPKNNNSKTPPRVFICSPYGGREENLELAKKWCRRAILEGNNPLAPHLFYPQFLDESNSDERSFGIIAGMFWLNVCDSMWVITRPDEKFSTGMCIEINHALEKGIPIMLITDGDELITKSHCENKEILGMVREAESLLAVQK
jgi:hypothetical protein